jgi:virginiamycin B lyase
MRSAVLWLVPIVCAVVFLSAPVPPFAAQAPDPTALSGRVTSVDEGPMEGVLVSAKKSASTVTVTVVSDGEGRYRFPESRLEPGEYAVRIRAAGYELERAATATVVRKKTATVDLELQHTRDLASQLTNADWFASFPGTEAQKGSIRGCTHCHTLERIVRTRYDVDRMMTVIERMSTYPQLSFPFKIQKLPAPRIGGGQDTPEQRRATWRRQAEYLATVNLSAGPQWTYPLKTQPRPKGRATHVIYTEYDLPQRTRQPHDVIVDSQGYAWYASFGEQILGRLDPKTNQIREWPIPVNLASANKGVLDIQFDEDENVWMGNGFQKAIHKFDRKTEKFQSYPISKELEAEHTEMLFVAPNNHKVDGKVWVTNNGDWSVLRVDLKSGKWDRFEPFKVPRPNIYKVFSDSQNNGWFTVFGRSHVGRIDAKTGEIKIFETPLPETAPRRGSVDSKDRFWVALNRTDRVAMFDPKTEKFQTWSLGIPEYYAYDVWTDRNGEAWASTEYADRVVRLNPATGEIVRYLLPSETNMRRAHGDNRSNPVSFWVGATHTASIVRLEPLE